MQPDKLTELVAGVIGALVGPCGTWQEIRAAVKDLVDDPDYWAAIDRADELVSGIKKLDG